MLIGLSGKKQAGKDTFCRLMQETYPVPVIRVALGDFLKEEVFKYVLEPHGIDIEALHDGRKENFRLILQGWGTDFKRKLVDDNYWIDCLDNHLRQANYPENALVVITDVRFPNEYDYIKNNGGLVFRVNRPPKGIFNKIKKLLRIGQDKHVSETSLDKHKFDYMINNNRTIPDMEIYAYVVRKVIRDKETNP